MKITTKTTKEQLKSFLGANAKMVKSKDNTLYEQMVYADKMLKKDETKVARKDLVDLAKSVLELLGSKCAEPVLAQETPVVENSVKKLAKGVSKKQEHEETPKDTKKEKTEKVEKSANKSLGKKKETPKEDATDLKEKEAVQNLFPQKLVIGDNKYELAHDIKDMEDLYKALENEEEIVFAFYYSKKMLKEAPYFYDMLGKPKSFEKDLDLATTIYVSEEKKVAYHISMYTEGCYNTLPEDFEEVEGVRYAGAMSFQIYRTV